MLRIAAMDLGSNSFHLVVVEAHPDGSFHTLLKEKEMLRLGDTVARAGVIEGEALQAAVDTVARFRALAESVDTDEVVACATSAIREADNSADVVERLRLDAAVDVEVISGRREAELIFQAVRGSVVLDPSPAVCLDLGGGSLEITVGDQQRLLASTSVKLGVARLTAELVEADPPSKQDLKRLRKRAQEVLAPAASMIAPNHPRLLVGTSGTFQALARMAVAQRTGDVPASVNQAHLHRREVEAIHTEAVAMPATDRKRLPGLDARRADLLPAGTTVLLAAMEVLGIDDMVVSEWALREGIIIDAIGHHDAADFSGDPGAIRRASVRSLARRCGWDEAHARQVARLAVALFDETRHLHEMVDADRDLLEAAALLHDIGEHVSVEGHHKHTAYLIEHGKLRGFRPEEVDQLVVIGRYHVRGEPKASFPQYGRLTADRQHAVRGLLALLRVADGLDASRNVAVERLRVVDAGDAVRLVITPGNDDGDVDLEVWGARRKRDLFEKVFGRRLHVAVDGDPR